MNKINKLNNYFHQMKYIKDNYNNNKLIVNK